ncbi:MAG: ATPase [Fibrobacter sp.]|nr:ATPase [Fibrobacter sp.]
MGYILALIGMGLMVGLSGAGSAIGLVIGGSSVLGMVKKKPEAFGSGMLLSALPASQGLYGFVGFIMYQGVVNPNITLFQGAVVLGAGLAISLACFISAIYQGKVMANGIAALGQGHNVFGNTMILGAFPELYAILSLVAAILMKSLIYN